DSGRAIWKAGEQPAASRSRQAVRNLILSVCWGGATGRVGGCGGHESIRDAAARVVHFRSAAPMPKITGNRGPGKIGMHPVTGKAVTAWFGMEPVWRWAVHSPDTRAYARGGEGAGRVPCHSTIRPLYSAPFSRPPPGRSLAG